MGQKLGAARGAPKRHLQVISWPLAGDIVRGGRPLKSKKKQWKNKSKSVNCAIKGNSLGNSMEREIRDRLAEPHWVQAEPAPHWD